MFPRGEAPLESSVGEGSTDRRLTAILCADVVGYSRLMAEDETATIRNLHQCRSLIADITRRRRGRVVDEVGDSLLAEFPTALDAVTCAVEVQRALGARNAGLPRVGEMEFRLGIHLGDVVDEGGAIYGTGINIASRLERLCQPGEICVSDIVYEQVRGKLELDWEDLGNQRVKNIPQPLRAYRVPSMAEGHSAGAEVRGEVPPVATGFSQRPAIAVLSFDNLSEAPEQEYFADGIAEDLITRLSAWGRFPIIARNSSFAYKNESRDVKRISRELAVRYVVEGSVRRAGDRVRIAAQLIDATSGHHIWADLFDRQLADIFALQDEIIQAIAGAIEPELMRFESERAALRTPENLDVWDCVMRGRWHVSRFTREDNQKARSSYQEAVELDPRSAEAFCGLAYTHYNDVLLQWTDSPGESIAEMVRAARRSVALDDGSAETHVVLGVAYSLTGQQEEMIAALELATQLNPSLSSAHFYLGTYLALAGRSGDAIERLETARRLNPRDPAIWRVFFGLALAHTAAGRDEEALNWSRQCLQRNPEWYLGHGMVAASYAHLGRLEEARTATAELLRLQPGFSLQGVRLLLSTATPALVERLIEGGRKAGLED
jgi:adenylate cyclase